MLESVRMAVSLPLLRKDFIVSPYQLYESKAAGADAVLLIVAALTPGLLASLQAQARDLGLECLVEVHTEAELEIANQEGCQLIGVNNRDLATFTTDLATSVRLAPMVRTGAICVSESGIRTRADIAALAQAGIHAVLIGEAFMRAPSPGGALADLRAITEPKQ
jgi:indole-3-glycerol phosphate synthase